MAASRFVRVRPLRPNPSRGLILAAVAAEPGLALRDLERATGLAWSTVRHHVRRLAQHGKLHVVKVGHVRLVFEEAPDARVSARCAALRRPAARRVLQALPGTQEEVAAQTGLSPSTVSRTLAALGRAGAVSIRLQGGRRLWSAGSRPTRTDAACAAG